MPDRFSGGTFGKFIASSGLTNLADGIATVAWAWLATLLTRDPLLIATVPIALRLPWLVFAIPAGIVTDRTDRRRLIVSMDILRFAAFAFTAVAIWLATPLRPPPAQGIDQWPLFLVIVGAALLVGVAEVFRDNAAQTILPSIVPHERLERANGRLWSVELTGNALIGPALGAALIALTPSLPFAVNAAAFALAVVLVASISGAFRPNGEVHRDWKKEFREGFEFLKGAPLLRVLALVTGFWNLLFHMLLIALVLHAQENLGLGATAYGLVLAAGAVGGIAGGLAGEAIVRRLGPGPTAAWMLFASVPAFFAIAWAPSAVILAIVLALFEFTGLVWNTVSVSYRQRAIPDALLGRVNSLYRLLAWGMMPLGLFASGVSVRAAEQAFAREWALLMPFFLAGAGAIALSALATRPILQGFKRAQRRDAAGG